MNEQIIGFLRKLLGGQGGQQAGVNQQPQQPSMGYAPVSPIQQQQTPRAAGQGPETAPAEAYGDNVWDRLEAAFEGGLGESIDWWAQNVQRVNNTPMRAIDHAPVQGGQARIGPGQWGLAQLLNSIGRGF